MGSRDDSGRYWSDGKVVGVCRGVSDVSSCFTPTPKEQAPLAHGTDGEVAETC